MTEEAKLKLHMFCVYSAIVFVALLSGALIFLAGFFPPPSPAMSLEQVAAMFAENQTGIRIAMILVMVSTCFYLFFTSVTAHYVSLLEGHFGVMTMMIALAGALNLLAFCLPAIWWLAASFRIDGSPEIIRALNDRAWLLFLGLAAPTFVLMFATSVAAFVDSREQVLFPRWFGYFNIWGITMFLPGQLIFFFHDGVFAWDGLIGFWLPAVDFFSQFLLTAYFVWKAVAREKDRCPALQLGP
ncbi:MAG: hypothetical protein GYB33_06620 [Gammaproteobacteria bacterium]|nr:hypothetical protein [Gammaproteobacteria bacterium]